MLQLGATSFGEGSDLGTHFFFMLLGSLRERISRFTFLFMMQRGGGFVVICVLLSLGLFPRVAGYAEVEDTGLVQAETVPAETVSARELPEEESSEQLLFLKKENDEKESSEAQSFENGAEELDYRSDEALLQQLEEEAERKEEEAQSKETASGEAATESGELVEEEQDEAVDEVPLPKKDSDEVVETEGILPLLEATASIKGEVFKLSGDGLPGVGVRIKGIGQGTRTDQKGDFLLEDLPIGELTIQFTKLGYIVVERVVTLAEDQLLEIRVPMEEQPVEFDDTEYLLAEVDVVGEFVEDDRDQIEIEIETEDVIKGLRLEGVVGREEFSQKNLRDVSDAVAKVSGANIVDGGRAVVRGLADRYVTALYDGSSISTTSPFRKAVSLDLFPTSAVEDIRVAKIYNATLPGDFGGATIDITPRRFPEERILDFQVRSSFDEIDAGDDFLVNSGEGLDFFGEAPFVDFVDLFFAANDAPTSELQTAGLIDVIQARSFLPQRDSQRPDLSFTLNYGDSFDLGAEGKLGVVYSLGRSSEDSAILNSFQNNIGAGTFNADRFLRQVTWNQSLGLTWQINRSNEIGFNYFLRQRGEDRVDNIFNFEGGFGIEPGVQTTGQIFEIAGNNVVDVVGGSFVGTSFVENTYDIIRVGGRHKLFGHDLNDEEGPLLEWSLSRSENQIDTERSTFRRLELDFNSPGVIQAATPLSISLGDFTNSTELFPQFSEVAESIFVGSDSPFDPLFSNRILSPEEFEGVSNFDELENVLVVAGADVGVLDTFEGLVDGSFDIVQGASIGDFANSASLFPGFTELLQSTFVQTDSPFEPLFGDRILTSEQFASVTTFNELRAALVAAGATDVTLENFDGILEGSFDSSAGVPLPTDPDRGTQFSIDDGASPSELDSFRETTTQFERTENVGVDFSFPIELSALGDSKLVLRTGADFERRERVENTEEIRLQLPANADVDGIAVGTDPDSGFEAELTDGDPNDIEILPFVSDAGENLVRQGELEQTIASFYGDAEWSWDNFTLRVGARKELVTRTSIIPAFGGELPSTSTEANLFGVSASYTLLNGVNFLASYSTTVARPIIKELLPFPQIDRSTGETLLGSAELSDSSITNVDFAVTFPKTGRFSGQVNLFQKQITDPILRFRSGSTTVFGNGQQGTIAGVELEGRVDLPFGLTWDANLAFIQGDLDFVSLQDSAALSSSFPEQPSQIFNTSLSYRNQDLGLNANLSLNLVSSFVEQLPANEQAPFLERQPAPQLDFSITKTFDLNHADLVLGFSVENIFGSDDSILFISSDSNDPVNETTQTSIDRGRRFSVWGKFEF